MTEDHGPAPEGVDSVGAVWAGLFALWRGLLTGLAATARRFASLAARVARAWALQWAGLARYHRDSTLPWNADGHADRSAAAAIGVRCFAFGLTLAALYAAGLRSSLLAAVAVVAEQLLWASARFIIIALVSPRKAIDRTSLSIVYLAGLLPYVMGATPTLRMLALAGSALLTYRGLQGAGLRVAEARSAIAWSFGGQAAVAAFGWILRALVALATL